MALRRLVLLATLVVTAWPSPLAAVSKSTSTSSARTGVTATTTTRSITLDPKVIVSLVRVAAYAPAVRVRAAVGTPSCPAAIKAAVGLTFQCLVPFDKTPVAFLVTIGEAGALDVRPTFPVVSLAAARIAAGVGATCGAAKATFVVLPIGATLACTIGAASVTLRVTDKYGALSRIPTR